MPQALKTITVSFQLRAPKDWTSKQIAEHVKNALLSAPQPMFAIGPELYRNRIEVFMP